MIRLLNRKFATSIDRFTKRGNNRPAINMQAGDQCGTFKLKNIKKIRQQGSMLLHFQHPSGMPYYHVDSAAIDNTFAILVKSQPDDSGSAYILEKMIQCGCHRYKIKDVIEQMKDRSFNSANLIETTDSFYCFPFQTHTTKDFYNLMSVYFHMVYQPLLTKSDFLQSCGRLKFLGDNPKNKLQFIGKGYEQCMTQEQILDTIMHRTIKSQLFTQDHSAIGRSQKMLRLRHEDIVNYHKNTFTLSNTVLFSHGDMSPIDHINNIQALLQQLKVNQGNKSVTITKERQYNLPKTVNIQHMEPYHIFMLCYKMPEMSTQQSIKMQILSYLLFDLPDSPFQKWLSLDLPYPRQYGMRDRTFNIGFSRQQPFKDSQVVGLQQSIYEELKSIVENGLPQSMIETCLSHLESTSYSEDGMKILESLSPYITSNDRYELSDLFNTSELINKLMRELRKKDVFAELIRKYLLDNTNYMRVIGKSNLEMTEKIMERNEDELHKIKKQLSGDQIKEVLAYKPSQQLQDPSSLPLIQVADYEFQQETMSQKLEVEGVKTTFVPNTGLPSIILKIDISDLEEENMNILELYCRSLAIVGYRHIDYSTYEAFLDRYIHNVDVSFNTARVDGGLKMYLFIKVEFLQRNAEFAFSIINGLVNRPNFNNLTKLSESIRMAASHFYEHSSSKCVEYGITYASRNLNAFLHLQDPVFHSRAVCSISSQILKVTNPKSILEILARRLDAMHKKIVERARFEMLVNCKPTTNSVIGRYLNLAVSSIPMGTKPTFINSANYAAKRHKAYLTGFNEPYIFESFQTSYLSKDSPAVAVLASTIQESMRKYKVDGGCVYYKGALTAYMAGQRKQFLDMEKHYFNNISLDVAKRRLFQHYRQHNPQYQFKYGLDLETVRFFKQAVIATSPAQVNDVRQRYIGQALKQEKSSMVMMGPYLENYEGLMKAGWAIQRLIDETSLSMQSQAKANRNVIQDKKYLLIA